MRWRHVKQREGRRLTIRALRSLPALPVGPQSVMTSRRTIFCISFCSFPLIAAGVLPRTSRDTDATKALCSDSIPSPSTIRLLQLLATLTLTVRAIIPRTPLLIPATPLPSNPARVAPLAATEALPQQLNASTTTATNVGLWGRHAPSNSPLISAVESRSRNKFQDRDTVRCLPTADDNLLLLVVPYK